MILKNDRKNGIIKIRMKKEGIEVKKKLVSLTLIIALAMIFVTGCGGSSPNAVSEEEGVQSAEEVEEKTEYGLNEWWEVEGLWKLKIDSVSFTDERNQFSEDEPEAVVVIKYTYENLGYEGDGQDLFITPDNVVDGEKKVVSTYPAGANVSVKPTPVGAIMEGAEESYGLTTSIGEITIYFEEYGNDYDNHKATFVIPLSSE